MNDVQFIITSIIIGEGLDGQKFYTAIVKDKPGFEFTTSFLRCTKVTTQDLRERFMGQYNYRINTVITADDPVKVGDVI